MGKPEQCSEATLMGLTDEQTELVRMEQSLPCVQVAVTHILRMRTEQNYNDCTAFLIGQCYNGSKLIPN